MASRPPPPPTPPAGSDSTTSAPAPTCSSRSASSPVSPAIRPAPPTRPSGQPPFPSSSGPQPPRRPNDENSLHAARPNAPDPAVGSGPGPECPPRAAWRGVQHRERGTGSAVLPQRADNPPRVWRQRTDQRPRPLPHPASREGAPRPGSHPSPRQEGLRHLLPPPGQAAHPSRPDPARRGPHAPRGVQTLLDPRAHRGVHCPHRQRVSEKAPEPAGRGDRPVRLYPGAGPPLRLHRRRGPPADRQVDGGGPQGRHRLSPPGHGGVRREELPPGRRKLPPQRRGNGAAGRQKSPRKRDRSRALRRLVLQRAGLSPGPPAIWAYAHVVNDVQRQPRTSGDQDLSGTYRRSPAHHPQVGEREERSRRAGGRAGQSPTPRGSRPGVSGANHPGPQILRSPGLGHDPRQ